MIARSVAPRIEEALKNQAAVALLGLRQARNLGPFSVVELPADEMTLLRLWLRTGFPGSYLPSCDEVSLRWRTDSIRTYLERTVHSSGFSALNARVITSIFFPTMSRCLPPGTVGESKAEVLAHSSSERYTTLNRSQSGIAWRSGRTYQHHELNHDHEFHLCAPHRSHRQS